MNDLVSVITPAYNCERFIGKTIESVLKQTYERWEMIIVDDFSSDGTMKIIEEYCYKDSRIKALRLDMNRGVANARNTAINLARGKYIAFLDSDDIWEKNKLTKQIEFMKNNRCAFTFTNYDLIDSEGNSLNKLIKVPHFIDYNDLLKGNSIPCLTVVINKEIIKEIKMPNIKHEDYATWLEILKSGIIAYGIDENLASYRKLNNSLSSNKIKSAKWTWEIYTKHQKISYMKSIVYMMFYIIKGFNKISSKL